MKPKIALPRMIYADKVEVVKMNKELVLVLIGLIIGMVVSLSCVDTEQTKSAEMSKLNRNYLSRNKPEVVYIFNVSYENTTYRCIYAEDWSIGSGGLWCERLEGDVV